MKSGPDSSLFQLLPRTKIYLLIELRARLPRL